MTEDLKIAAGPTDASAQSMTSGCACCAPSSEADQSVPAAATPTSSSVDPSDNASGGVGELVEQRYAIAGMTCGHCVGAVTDELRALNGVSDVHIDLVAGGSSTAVITSSAPLVEADVAAAVDEAGYELVGRTA